MRVKRKLLMTQKVFTQFSLHFDTKLSERYKQCRWMNNILSHSLSRPKLHSTHNMYADIIKNSLTGMNWHTSANLIKKFTQHDHIVQGILKGCEFFTNTWKFTHFVF